jgi:hypothetical protein
MPWHTCTLYNIAPCKENVKQSWFRPVCLHFGNIANTVRSGNFREYILGPAKPKEKSLIFGQVANEKVMPSIVDEVVWLDRSSKWVVKPYSCGRYSEKQWLSLNRGSFLTRPWFSGRNVMDLISMNSHQFQMYKATGPVLIKARTSLCPSVRTLPQALYIISANWLYILTDPKATHMESTHMECISFHCNQNIHVVPEMHSAR